MNNIFTKDLTVDGAKLITMPVFDDSRGWFAELYNSDKLPFMPEVKQISQSNSKNNVIRGLHYQYGPAMCKMIRVLRGAAIFYVVDVRPRRLPRMCPVWLSAEVGLFLFVPAHCAVGFQTVDYEQTEVEYFHSELHNSATAITIAYDDPDINIQWHPANEYILSEKDQVGMSYKHWLGFIETHDIKFPS